MRETAVKATDEELMLLLCAAVDRNAADPIFHEVYERYHARVVSWCYRVARDRENATDLAQEVFLKAYRYRHSFRGEARLSTWLYAIARNHCITALGKTDGNLQPLDTIPALALRDHKCVAPDRAAEQNELAARLLRLMSRILEPMEVRVMTLHYAHDVSLAAITHDLGLRNPSGAKAYIVNARRKLFGKLRRQRHGEEFWKIDAAA